MYREVEYEKVAVKGHTHFKPRQYMTETQLHAPIALPSPHNTMPSVPIEQAGVIPTGISP